MRIAHGVGWYFPDSVGGTEVYVAGLCSRLRSAGHSVAIAAPDPHCTQEHHQEHAGVPVFRYPIPATPTRAEAQGVVAARGTERLARWLAEWQPDVFHVHTVTTGLGRHEVAAARQVGARTVFTHHLPGFGYVCRRGTLMRDGEHPCDGVTRADTCAACVLQMAGMPRPMRRIVASLPIDLSRCLGRMAGPAGTAFGLAASIVDNRAMQRELTDAIDCTVVLNDAGRAILVANGAPPSKITINRLGHAFTSLPRRPPAGSPLRVGFLGRLHPIKGVRELARAVRLVPRTVPFTIELRGLIQSDVDRRLLANVNRLVGDDPRVTFAPAVPHAEAPTVLASYDVICCPSISFENGPTVAIEAMAVGTPVIGTRVGNLAELIEDGVDGRLVSPGSVPELAHAIEQVALKPAIVDAWRRNLRRARSMDAVAADYLRLYHDLCAAPTEFAPFAAGAAS